MPFASLPFTSDYFTGMETDAAGSARALSGATSRQLCPFWPKSTYTFPSRASSDRCDIGVAANDHLGQNEASEPEQYQDLVRSKMMEWIQQKIDGQEILLPPEEAPEAKIVDLMEALKASVAGGTGRVSGTARKSPATTGKKTGSSKRATAGKAAADKKPAAKRRARKTS